jgi:hypothetical protein
MPENLLKDRIHPIFIYLYRRQKTSAQAVLGIKAFKLNRLSDLNMRQQKVGFLIDTRRMKLQI